MRTERYIDMKSPITGGRVKLVEDIEQHEFRKEQYTVHVRYCLCEDSGEQFTMEGQDDFVLNQIYNQYRLSHGIPFPDEIKALRERYGLNYAQMSRILGFGTNQWKLYEQGVVPSESNGKMIIAIREKQCMLSLLEASRAEFKPADYDRVKTSIMSAENAGAMPIEHALFYGHTERGMMNGFTEMNVDKLQSMILYLIGREGGSICPSKLNLEMFYADFLHFRRHSKGISGLQYHMSENGPAPQHYDTIYDNVVGVKKESTVTRDFETVRLCSTALVEQSCLTKEEMDTLSLVSAVMCPMNASEALAYGQKERAWENHRRQTDLISYSSAYDLRDMM